MRFIACLFTIFFICSVGFAQHTTVADSGTWTRESAIRQLQLHPRDAYLQFVAMQLSKTRQEATQVRQWLPQRFDPRFGVQRNAQINLFSIFSGALAIQESLQLDAMTGSQRRFAGQPTVSIDALSGPTVKSHPWSKMLAGRHPSVSRLAECVPDDHLFVRFGSVSKLLAMRDLLDQSYAYTMGQTTGSIRSHGAIGKLKQQWMIETSGLLEPLYDTAFGEVAVTSSDLFFREGTDATLIMRLKQPTIVRTALNQVLKAMAAGNSQAKIETGEYLGVAYTHVSTPDRSLHVYAADPADDIHIRSNSRVGFERIIRTMLGKSVDGTNVSRMSDSDEFNYIRTLMPLGADEEDGFVYLSDSFIRRLIGPEKKLTQRNRLVCRSHLQMVRHAQLLFLTQHGRDAESIEELRSGGCLGNRGSEMKLDCPDGGNYSLTSERGGCLCSHHGHPDTMVPCAEVPVSRVPQFQADQYHQFVEEYSRYWSTFFDPIAVRFKVEPDKVRMETIVLPLINNSIYRALASVVGGETESLDSLPVPNSNIATLALKLNKDQLLEQAGVPRPALEGMQEIPEREEIEPTAEFIARRTAADLRQIGLAMHNFHSAYRQLPPAKHIGEGLPPNRRLSWRVQILPFLEEQELYEKFRHDEPWDSEHNLSLVKEIPDIFAVVSSEAATEGKTRFVLPQHAKAFYRGPEISPKFRDVLDGLSNTIMAVVADEDRAVTWTKPDELPIDLDQPRQGWAEGDEDVVVLMGDGAVVTLRADIDDEKVAELITRDGREVAVVHLDSVSAGPMGRRRGGLPFLIGQEQDVLLEELSLDRFLYHGIGNQIGIHICDDKPLVDLNVSRLAGLFTSSGRGGGFMSPNFSMLAVLALAMNTPVYVAIPVENAKIVDETLEKLDHFLVKVTRERANAGSPFLEIHQDAYQLMGIVDPSVRTYAFRFGPLTWRFYWMRIDNGLYITSTPELIGVLRRAAATQKQTSVATNDSESAHGLVRIRPEHWQQIKPHFRIGWSESERRSCLKNLAPLSHAGRALLQEAKKEAGANVTIADVRELADQLFVGPHRCASHGSYVLNADTGECHCDIHGQGGLPKQPPPTGEGEIAEFAESLRDVRMKLTFLDDGLHAVVTIEQKEKSR